MRAFYQIPINRAKMTARGARWRASKREIIGPSGRVHHITVLRIQMCRRHGITAEQFVAMLEAGGEACHLCLRSFDMTRANAIHIDHCHSTGAVRGLLCVGCNCTVLPVAERVGVDAIARYLRVGI